MSTLLAFDFGLARIGVAVGETETGHAHPLAVIAEEANAARFAAIEKLLAEWKPAGLVVGLPTHVDGTEHAMGEGDVIYLAPNASLSLVAETPCRRSS